LGHSQLEHSFHWNFFWKILENINYGDEASITHTPSPEKPPAVTLSYHSAAPKTSVLASSWQFCALEGLILPTVSGREGREYF
jgi:hypothetical protein